MAANERAGLALPIVGVPVLLLLVASPLVPHFTQKSHNRLPFDIVAELPTEQPLAGGEVFAATLIALIEPELEGGRTGWRPNDFFLWGPKDTAFRNDPENFWLPAAETKLREGVRHLRAYVKGSAPRRRPRDRSSSATSSSFASFRHGPIFSATRTRRREELEK